MQVAVGRFRFIDKGALKAACSITITSETYGDIMDINGVKVLDGSNGLFVSMPAEKGNDQKYYALVFIKNKGLKDAIDKAVLEHYEQATAGVATSKSPF